MRVIGIVRLSRLTEQSLSPDKQKEIITASATAHGHEIVGWAEDLDVSGDVSPFDRPQFGRWLTDEKAPEYDGMIAWKLDRYSRRLLHFADLLGWCDQHDKSIIAVSESLDTSTKFGRMMAQLVALFAEWELDTIKERTRSGKAAMRKTRRFAGGKIPYGYWPVPGDGGMVLEIDPESSRVIRDMVRRILEGQSMGEVRRHLVDSEIPVPTDYVRIRKGKESKRLTWSTRAVSVILRSRSLLGQFEHNGRVVRGLDGLPLQRAEALITEDEFRRLQVKLDQAVRPAVYNNPKALLADLMTCHGCGGKLYKHIPRSTGRVYEYYRCSARNNGRLCEAPASMRAAALEESVTTAFLAAVGNAERRERQWVPGEDHSEELARIEQAIAEAREEWDLGLYEGQRAEYLDRLRALTDRRTELAALPSRAGAYEFVGMGETYAEAWERSDTAGRREMLIAAGISVVVGWDERTQSDVTIHIPIDALPRTRSGGIDEPAWATKLIRFTVNAKKVAP